MKTSRFSVKSKLIFVLLITALLSMLAIAFQSLHAGKETLEERIEAQLTSIRETKKTHLESYLDRLRKELLAMAADPSLMTATKEFSSAFSRLQKTVLTNEEIETLTRYYNDVFIPRLSANVDGHPEIDYLLPRQPAARYLQYHYIADNDNPPGKKDALNAARGRSYYSGVHAHYHPVFRQKVRSFGYYDLFLVDFDGGNIIYSVSKETDFATSLRAGPYKTSGLAQLYELLRQAPNPGEARIIDFTLYRPSYGAPAGFAGTTVFDEERRPIGMLVVQIPIDRIDAIMSDSGNWEQSGLGKTGEVVLVGNDLKMRSTSRRLLAQRESCDPADRACRLGTTVLIRKIDNSAVYEALAGKSGVTTVPAYDGEGKIITAYGPIASGDLQWTILANMDHQEAFTPIFDFQKALLTAVVILSSLATFAAMWIGYAFTRPIETLVTSARRLRQDKKIEPIDIGRDDEFGDLADAYNHMVEVIHEQHETIEAEKHRNRELLLNIIPENVAEKVAIQYDNGLIAPRYAEKVSNTTILFSALSGFTRYAESLDAAQAVTELNRLIDAFDSAAEKHGVEKIQTVGDSYMAASGITVSRLDHSRRCLMFAREMLEIVHHFNQSHGISLGIRIGIHTGEAFAGIIGQRNFVFDVWGDTVNIASRLRFDTIPNSILVTEAVFDRLGAQEGFDAADDIVTSAHGRIRVWRWQPDWAIDEDAETVIMENPVRDDADRREA